MDLKAHAETSGLAPHLVYELSEQFHATLFRSELGTEPILVADGGPPDLQVGYFLFDT
jgi:hypothetical protein